MLDYLDVVVEDVERLERGRSNLNKSAFFILSLWLIFTIFSLMFYSIGFYFTCIVLLVCCTMNCVIFVGLIIKREIYGVMIYLKKTDGG